MSDPASADDASLPRRGRRWHYGADASLDKGFLARRTRHTVRQLLRQMRTIHDDGGLPDSPPGVEPEGA